MERQTAYRQLIRARIVEMTLEAMFAAFDKAWVLGSDRVKRRIAKELDRPVTPGGDGGDRRSEAYRRAAKYERTCSLGILIINH